MDCEITNDANSITMQEMSLSQWYWQTYKSWGVNPCKLITFTEVLEVLVDFIFRVVLQAPPKHWLTTHQTTQCHTPEHFHLHKGKIS